MAQHIDALRIGNKRVQEIARAIYRKDKVGLAGSLVWQRVDNNTFVTDRRVPESIVYGGRATFEAHTNDMGKVTEVYLVA